MFLSNFYPYRLQINKGNFFVSPLKFATVKEIAKPKVTALNIHMFNGLQEMFLVNFYPCRLLGK